MRDLADLDKHQRDRLRKRAGVSRSSREDLRLTHSRVQAQSIHAIVVRFDF